MSPTGCLARFTKHSHIANGSGSLSMVLFLDDETGIRPTKAAGTRARSQKRFPVPDAPNPRSVRPEGPGQGSFPVAGRSVGCFQGQR